MKNTAVLVDRVLLTLLGVSTGAVKLAQMNQEMEIFRAAGFSDGLTIAFGVVQLGAALLLIPKPTVRLGASVLAVTFVLATGVLFVNGMLAFGVFSLLFILMAAIQVGYPPSRLEAPRPTSRAA